MLRPFGWLSVLNFSVIVALSYLIFNAVPTDAQTPRTPGDVSPWVTGYYLSGDNDSGRYPIDKIDFHALTDVIDFANFPGPGGTLDPARTISVQQSQEIIGPAHAAGCKVIVGLATDDGTKFIRQDITDQYRATFVNTLVQFVLDRGYDGIDIDYEPIIDSDVPNFTAFIQEIRAAMDAKKPGLLLTVAAADQPEMYANIQNCFDQINLMTYDLSGKYQDFKSWYNSNLYGDPYERMLNYQPYPSVDDMVTSYLTAGVSRSKLAIGVAFYGYVWTGISGPKQDISSITNSDINDGADYRTIMDTYYTKSRYHWDPIAYSAYLSIVAATPDKSIFVSYDDERACAEKVKYARENGLGGVMIWELGAGYRPTQKAGSQDTLLQAVRKANAQP
jgi:chitinase